ncbi:MAG TPA: N-acetylmuramoyl-L-alanine amidase, partial [Actinocrinis sp.]|uniref:N-acetylmuramoyl-L-alanine amidase n=1 Tax=Actinocrinis sp. TaxID=1920516 RepID=UPI002DDD1D73
MARRPGIPVPSPRASVLSIVVSAGLTTALAGCGASGSPAATAQAPAAAGAVGQASSPSAPASATTASPQTSASASAKAASPSAAGSSGPAADGLAGKVVAIDPGHNGGNAANPSIVNALVPMGFGQYKACDTTGTAAPDGYTEHAFNFDVAERLDALLTARGVKVVLTRPNDTGVGPCVNIRAAIGNNAHADAAISIHADGYASSGHGFQIIEASASVGGRANDAASNQLSQALHTTMLAESGFTPATYIGDDGYESRNDLAGLNLSTVP